MGLSNRYKDLKSDIEKQLYSLIEMSKGESKHIGQKYLKVELYDYEELVSIDGSLIFLDADGLHYSLYAEARIEDLLDIINSQPFRVAIGDEGKMSSLQGKINCSYSKLVEIFGEPSEGFEDISEVQWSIMIGDTYVSIYDYKNPNPPKENTMWHIGGFSEDAVTKVKKILGL